MKETTVLKPQTEGTNKREKAFKMMEGKPLTVLLRWCVGGGVHQTLKTSGPDVSGILTPSTINSVLFKS